MTREQFMRMIERGCGYACPYRDIIGGGCERHGPTEADRIVERVTAAFREDVRRILGLAA